MEYTCIKEIQHQKLQLKRKQSTAATGTHSKCFYDAL